MEEIADLPQLADPTDPVLMRTANMYDEYFDDPDHGHYRCTVLGSDWHEVAETITDDVVAGYGDVIQDLTQDLTDYELPDKYGALRRGRSVYRDNALPVDADRPVAERAHRDYGPYYIQSR